MDVDRVCAQRNCHDVVCCGHAERFGKLVVYRRVDLHPANANANPVDLPVGLFVCVAHEVGFVEHDIDRPCDDLTLRVRIVDETAG